MPESNESDAVRERPRPLRRRAVLASLGAAAVGGLAGCSGSDSPTADDEAAGGTAADVTFEHPDAVRFDEPVTISIDGVPHDAVGVNVWLEGGETTWHNGASYPVDDGTLALEETAPGEAEFGAGLLNLLQWATPEGFVQAYYPESDPGDRVVVELKHGTETIATTAIDRTVGAGVTEREIDAEDFVGWAYEPPGDDPVPGVILLHGSEGVPPRSDAELLAARGYYTVALHYFEWEDEHDLLPNELIEVPVEFVANAADWLLGHDRTTGDQVGLWGLSKGAELALLAGSRFDSVGAVVSISGSGYVWSGVAGAGSGASGSSWTQDGEPVPYVPYTNQVEGWDQETPLELEPVYRASLEQADEETRTDAAIPVEDVDGPVLLVSGGDDRLWNTVELHRAAADRLAGHDYDHEHLVYDDAGHRIMIPYRPATNRTEGYQYVYGGTTAGYAEADVDHWPRVVETFETLRAE